MQEQRSVSSYSIKVLELVREEPLAYIEPEVLLGTVRRVFKFITVD